MKKGGYLPVGCVAIDKDELEELKKKAELYDMYQKQMKTARNGVFLPKDEYQELLKKAKM